MSQLQEIVYNVQGREQREAAQAELAALRARVLELEAPRTCALCFHYTSNGYGKHFCTSLDSNVYDIARPGEFSCSEFCLPRAVMIAA